MTAQPETLKFGPQWIRKLSDCGFSPQRHSNRRLSESEIAARVGISTEDDELVDFSNKTDRMRLEGTETAWECLTPNSLGDGPGVNCGTQRSHGPPGTDVQSTQLGDSSFYTYGFPSIDKDMLGDKPPDVPSWQKATDQAVADQNWRRHLQMNNFPADTGNWKHRCSPTVTSGDNQLSRGSGLQANSLWGQQRQLWSKSTPHKLHGIEPLDTVTAAVLGQNVSCSVPEIEKAASLIEHTKFFETTDSAGPFNSSGSRPTTYSSLEEERDLHCPDGADDPDEHMWLYEDPQGRTQGTFSDAQMNEWLLAGIYFTPNLRIRRKCDDTFSTLADYTRLFGRIPFASGHRVSPIHGGINPTILAALTKPCSLERGPIECVDSSGLQRSHGLSSTTSSSATNVLGHCLHAAPQQSNFSTDFQNNSLSNGVLNQSDSSRLVPGTTSMCVNSSLPVLQSQPQANSLPHNFVSSKGSLESDAHVSANAVPSSTSTSAFMALASLLSMNPTLASLALSFSGQSSSGHTTDLASAALTPGFLSALAQYLNVQPYTSNHQPFSPMQQLAETAQLAAQLAALAGAHSPDQTPMQPEQALALAQLVMSQACSTQWSTHSKKDGATEACPESEPDAVDRRSHNAVSDGSAGKSLPGEEHRLDQQSHWPPLISTDNTARGSPRFPDGRLPMKGVLDTSQHGDSRNGQSRGPVGFPKTQQQQLKSSQTNSSRSAATKGKHTNGAISESGQSGRRSNETGSDDAHCTPERTRGPPAHTSSNRTPPNAGQLAQKVKQTPNKSSAQTARSDMENGRVTGSSTHISPNITNKNSVTNARNNRTNANQSVTTPNNLQSPVKPARTNVETKGPKPDPSSLDDSQTLADCNRNAEEELERLTSWCQARLSSIPLKEKVDIPTVVELLATLDAPYEVERMVQTFMGESARTSLFVKDFLDRRRPFWQLHRERRDNESFKQVGSQAKPSTVISVTPKSGEKKKRAGGQEGKQNPGPNSQNGTAGWTKVGHTQTSQMDHSQDNQWHHIKPKGSHNRKGKKDKVS